ncbi:MAG TPA: hypothetical protein DCP31_28520, partial [Cyanobacteria bacterium UBA8543]|nr:hypothetical protein [Cyanobacteria bacterium UBA8543]
MSYPSMSEYREVLQNPRLAFKESELQNATVKQTPLGLPSLVSGGFALTACLTTQTGSRWAIRCFHKEVPDLQERYRYISNFLQNTNDIFFVKFKYEPEGIKVRGSWYPIVKMAWVDGQSLNGYIEDNLSQPSRLQGLADQIKQVSARLHALKMAHGDLQHGNILVRNNGSITLIDYDGMYVPQMPYKQSNEIGHVAFQHPERGQSFFNDKIDCFSSITIYLSLLCLATSSGKDIWNKYHTGENLIFSRKDYQDPANSTLFSELKKNSHVASLVSRFQEICLNRVEDVPSIEQFLNSNSKIILRKALPNRRLLPSISSPIAIQGQFNVFSASQIREIVQQDGNKITVCGKVSKVDYETFSEKIVFINFVSSQYKTDNYRPFTIVVFPNLLKNFYKVQNLQSPSDLKSFENKYFKVTGLLELYKKKNGDYTPQISLEDPYQLVEITKNEADRLLSGVDTPTTLNTVPTPVPPPPPPKKPASSS